MYSAWDIPIFTLAKSARVKFSAPFFRVAMESTHAQSNIYLGVAERRSVHWLHVARIRAI